MGRESSDPTISGGAIRRNRAGFLTPPAACDILDGIHPIGTHRSGPDHAMPVSAPPTRVHPPTLPAGVSVLRPLGVAAAVAAAYALACGLGVPLGGRRPAV